MENRGAERRPNLSRNAAEALGASGLSFLASEPDRLSRFLQVSGLGPDTLRAAASAPGFLAAVLDYVLSDEPLLLAFAASADVGPEQIARARRALDLPA